MAADPASSAARSGATQPRGRVLSVDVGGTFIDVLCQAADGALSSFKLPSSDLAAPVRAADPLIAAVAASSTLLYSTTVAVNSLLSGRVPRVGLIVTAGFRELLETARLPAGDAVGEALPGRLVALEWVREVSARLDAEGRQRAALDRTEVEHLAREYQAAGIDVVAVALLHSYRNPCHERAVVEVFAALAPEIEVVCSSTVLPELREYERTLATALNAVLIPVLRDHLAPFFTTAPALWLMQSNGLLVGAADGARQPLRTALSGPGAAVVGMRWLGERCGFRDLITLDVGGTSTDVALISDARYRLTASGTVAGFPLRLPMIDVLSVGAGGGSIAHEGADRRWHVGPQSAGADPGPACYARGGTAPTLTDAQLLLGRIPDALLGGSVALDRARARAALEQFGVSRGFDAVRTARGILAIATHHMCGAIRRVSVQRGFDPGAHALLAMGGAGPLHAAELAALLGINTVIVPPQPGLAAAWGLMVAEIGRDFVAPIATLASALGRSDLLQHFERLEDQSAAWIRAQGCDTTAAARAYLLDLRYRGMHLETAIEGPADPAAPAWLETALERFHTHFENLSGRSWRDHEDVEVVNLRLAVSVARAPAAPWDAATSTDAAAETSRAVGFLDHDDMLDTRVIARGTLSRGTTLSGPAVIEQYESTTLLPPAWGATVDDFDNLILRPLRAARID